MRYIIFLMVLILSTMSVASAENITTNYTPDNSSDTLASEDNASDNDTNENSSITLAANPSEIEAAGSESQIDSNWYPYIPLSQDPKYFYTVRLWVLDHDPVYDQTAPVDWHELTPAEFAAMGESSAQHVSILKYDAPNPFGQTVYGVFHQELNFVLWMAIIAGSGDELGQYAQIGETAKDTYNDSLTPAQNDALGNISWFVVNGTWYPRTWTKSDSYAGQTWSELWGPFDPDPQGNIFRERNYTVSIVPVIFKGVLYQAVKVTIVGLSETSPDIIATEAYTFIDKIGMFERYFNFITVANPSIPGLPPSTMIFQHIANLIDTSIVLNNPENPTSNGTEELGQNVNAATISMQHTGIPIGFLILAILMLFGGLAGSKRK